MNYQDLIDLYLQDYNNRKQQDYINNNTAHFQTRGIDGVKDLSGRIEKYGNYLKNGGNFLAKSNNSLIKNAGNKISAFGNNIAQKAGQVNGVLNMPNEIMNGAKSAALTKTGAYLQNSAIPAVQKIGAGLSSLGGASAVGSGAATTAGTSAATTGGAAAGGAAGGSAMGGAAAAGPWAAIAALAVMALQGTNRKRAAASGESLMGDSFKTLNANSEALNKARQAEEEQVLNDMYSKYGWIK